eukprot:13978828-Ditylum_brightwellii.AAC.1
MRNNFKYEEYSTVISDDGVVRKYKSIPTDNSTEAVTALDNFIRKQINADKLQGFDSDNRNDAVPSAWKQPS